MRNNSAQVAALVSTLSFAFVENPNLNAVEALQNSGDRAPDSVVVQPQPGAPVPVADSVMLESFPLLSASQNLRFSSVLSNAHNGSLAISNVMESNIFREVFLRQAAELESRRALDHHNEENWEGFVKLNGAGAPSFSNLKPDTNQVSATLAEVFQLPAAVDTGSKVSISIGAYAARQITNFLARSSPDASTVTQSFPILAKLSGITPSMQPREASDAIRKTLVLLTDTAMDYQDSLFHKNRSEVLAQANFLISLKQAESRGDRLTHFLDTPEKCLEILRPTLKEIFAEPEQLERHFVFSDLALTNSQGASIVGGAGEYDAFTGELRVRPSLGIQVFSTSLHELGHSRCQLHEQFLLSKHGTPEHGPEEFSSLARDFVALSKQKSSELDLSRFEDVLTRYLRNGRSEEVHYAQLDECAAHLMELVGFEVYCRLNPQSRELASAWIAHKVLKGNSILHSGAFSLAHELVKEHGGPRAAFEFMCNLKIGRDQLTLDELIKRVHTTTLRVFGESNYSAVSWNAQLEKVILERLPKVDSPLSEFMAPQIYDMLACSAVGPLLKNLRN